MVVKRIQMIAPGYTDILHPETDSGVVVMANGVTLENTAKDINKITIAGGTANDLTLTIPSISSYNVNKLSFVGNSDNGGNATTLNINGLGTKPLYKSGGGNPKINNSRLYTCYYADWANCFFLEASAEGTSVASDVLAGKTFSNDSDTGLVGIMPNYSNAENIGYMGVKSVKSDGVGSLVFEPYTGYYREGLNSNGYGSIIKYDANFIPSNLLAGNTYFGLAGGIADLGASQNAVNTWTDGNGRLVLRIPSKGAFTGVMNGTYPDLGYTDANYIASNILSGKSIFGLAGTAIDGVARKRIATGNFVTAITFNGQEITISGLAFAPSIFTLKIGATTVNYNSYLGINQSTWSDANYGVSSGNFGTYGSSFVRSITSSSVTIKWADNLFINNPATAYWSAIE